MRRYEIKAVFDDSDYGDLQVGAVKKFWSINSARHQWYLKEFDRRQKSGTSWHFIIWDHKTNTDITPDHFWPGY